MERNTSRSISGGIRYEQLTLPLDFDMIKQTTERK